MLYQFEDLGLDYQDCEVYLSACKRKEPRRLCQEKIPRRRF